MSWFTHFVLLPIKGFKCRVFFFLLWILLKSRLHRENINLICYCLVQKFMGKFSFLGLYGCVMRNQCMLGFLSCDTCPGSYLVIDLLGISLD